MQSNPRSPEEATRNYYLVPKGMKLRYPPQYADISFDDLSEALVTQEILKNRGVKYTVYDKNGERIDKPKVRFGRKR